MEELGGPAVTSTADEARRSSGPASRNGCSPDRAGDRQLRCGKQKPRFGRGPPLHERQHRLRAGAAAARGSPGWVSWLRWATATAQAPACRGFPSSTKPRASTWRKTRWCGDRAQAGHGWPALACWSQGRRNQAMRTIPALPRLHPKPVDSGAFQPGRIRHPFSREKDLDSTRPRRGFALRRNITLPQPGVTTPAEFDI